MWKIKIFTYLNIDILLKIFSNDRKLFEKYFKSILKMLNYTFYDDIIFDNLSLNFLNLYPKVQEFEINHLIESNEIVLIKPNRYIYNGDTFSKSNSFIFSKYVLPHPKNSSIPFTINMIQNEKIVFTNSNIFYFEIFLDVFNFREKMYNEIIQIGFTNTYDKLSDLEFGKKNSFGFDFMKNVFLYKNNTYDLPINISKGDIIGIGLRYVGLFEYSIFLTHNGNYIDFFEYSIITSSLLKIILNLKSSTGLKLNFGEEEFCFDLNNINMCNKLIFFTKFNFTNTGYNDDTYIVKNIMKKMFKYNNSELIYNILSKLITESNI